MTNQKHSLHTLITHWRAIAVMLVAHARLVCRREQAGADGILEQVDQLEVAVRAAQVMVCRQIMGIPGADEHSRDVRDQLCAIAAMFLCLTVFLMTLRLRLRGGSAIGRVERSDPRRADVPGSGRYRFAPPAARSALQKLAAPP